MREVLDAQSGEAGAMNERMPEGETADEAALEVPDEAALEMPDGMAVAAPRVRARLCGAAPWRKEGNRQKRRGEEEFPRHPNPPKSGRDRRVRRDLRS
jgi:hypothetical protein